MNLPILIRNDNSSIKSFIDCWKKFYEADYDSDKVYFENLKSINELTEENIQELFSWKNPTKHISGGKQKSVDKIKADLSIIKLEFSHIGNSDDNSRKIYDYSCVKIFTDEYIWNLFLLHILKYEYCPIADRYAYMAFKFIHLGEYKKLSGDKSKSWNTYLEYKNFFNEIAKQTNRCTLRERKEIDEALCGFGKFLENYPKIILEGGKIDI